MSSNKRMLCSEASIHSSWTSWHWLFNLFGLEVCFCLFFSNVEVIDFTAWWVILYVIELLLSAGVISFNFFYLCRKKKKKKLKNSRTKIILESNFHFISRSDTCWIKKNFNRFFFHWTLSCLKNKENFSLSFISFIF